MGPHAVDHSYFNEETANIQHFKQPVESTRNNVKTRQDS